MLEERLRPLANKLDRLDYTIKKHTSGMREIEGLSISILEKAGYVRAIKEVLASERTNVPRYTVKEILRKKEPDIAIFLVKSINNGRQSYWVHKDDVPLFIEAFSSLDRVINYRPQPQRHTHSTQNKEDGYVTLEEALEIWGLTMEEYDNIFLPNIDRRVGICFIKENGEDIRVYHEEDLKNLKPEIERLKSELTAQQT